MDNLKLKEKLGSFKGNQNGRIDEEFKEIAKYLLFNGYLLINNSRKVYIRSVELYYHEENGTMKDSIMYHRNKNGKKEPYFESVTLNAHASGIDFCFENESAQYRASILVRGFDIVEKGKEQHEKMDARSTYFYDALLKGVDFSNGLTITWEEEKIDDTKWKLSEPLERINTRKKEEQAGEKHYNRRLERIIK